MTAAFDPGALDIALALAGGRVEAVRVRSTRPTGHGRLFVGRDGAEAPMLARRLFALCARAQSAASAEAVAAATGVRRPEAARAADAIGVLAERAAEALRASFLGWPWGEGASLPRPAAQPLREAVAAASVLRAATQADLSDVAPLRAALARLAAAAEALGAAAPGLPPAESAFAAISAQCAAETGLAFEPPDALRPADDHAVVAALAGDPAGFAARPSMPGRRPETGAFARFWREVPQRGGAFAARLEARRLDIGDALAALRKAVDGDVDASAVLTGGLAGEARGFGAVECARGRLHHVAEMGRDGRIAAYAVVAPTEWNFHPDGPYVAALAGARLGDAARACLMAARLAALVDPCVAFRVRLED